MVNWKYILAGIIMLAIAFLIVKWDTSNRMEALKTGQMGGGLSFENTLYLSVFVYLLGLIGFITIVIGIFKEAPRRYHKYH